MRTRIFRFFVFLLGWSVFLLNMCAAAAPQSTAAAEPSAPQASPAVQKMLDEAGRLAEAKQTLNSVMAADRALAAAREGNDKPGEALAQQSRAKGLQDLKRTDEALAAWQAAAQIWAEAGDTSEQITALVQAGLLYLPDKKTNAEKLFAQALSAGKLEAQRLRALAQALHDSGVALDAQGQEQAAWNYLSAALAIREKETPESLELVQTLNALAKLSMNRAIHNAGPQYYYMGRDYSSRAVEIGQRLAHDTSILAESLQLLGRSEYLIADGKADPMVHYTAALQIRRKLEPDGSMEQAAILREMAVWEDRQTDFAAAHAHLQEAVALGEKFGPATPEFEHGLENLANVETDEGDLAAARVHLQRALGINEKLGREWAPTFINMGVVVLYQGDYAGAREYFEKALALFKKTDPNTLGSAFALENLGETSYRAGDFASALEFRRSALVIIEDRLGVSLDTADALNGMGDVFRSEGRLSEAAEYYNRALDMQMKIAPESLHVSQSLAALAQVARVQRNPKLAMEYDQRALELGQKSCPNSWCVGDILNDLGELAYEQGDLKSSESYLRRAVDIREKSLGPAHPDLARNLNGLALTVAAEGKTPEAFDAALRAERIGAEHLRVSVRTLSERQALAYEDIRASGLDVALTLAADRASTPSARSEVFDAVIRSRALVFDELAARHRSAYGSGDPEVTQLAEQLLSARARLATLVFRGVGDMKPEVYRSLLDEARRGKEKAERALAERSLAFRQDQARAQLGLKEIAASLPQGAVLVAFVRYARHDFQEPGTNNDAPEPVPSYAAFVLRAGKNEPEVVPLGAAREIERALAAWRRDITRQADVLDVSAKMGESTYRRTGAALRRRIWDPLAPGLGDAREVFVVPDAALHLVNLASLPVGNSQYLVETGPLIHYLSTERDLVPTQSRRGEGILLFGNPAFDQVGMVGVASTQQPASTGAATTTGAFLRGFRSACGAFQTLHFPPLPASQQEVENIAALWKRSSAGESAGTMREPAAQPGGELLQMTGADASPEAFEQYAPGRRVLHVATHGFFLEGSCESAEQRRLDARTRDESVLPATAENPLLLSGLAFAGANHRAPATPNEADGILTAEEIAGINLEGVDWAVLSACDTGVGEIKVGEGVFGLRRAFQLAGAKTVIMSLWPVEDETTRQWMATLYREHFLNGKDTSESVRTASLQILRQHRARHQSTHPFYWAAFIAAGDWR